MRNEWLQKKKDNLELNDLKEWLSQEYFVSVDFVNWFLLAASQTNDLKAKTILAQNIWKELGEGKLDESHVAILEKFLEDINFDFKNLICFEETGRYLKEMRKIIQMGFWESVGALGPANEYLLKLEYGAMANAYQKLKTQINLPEPKFFQVNLNADESHAAKLFELIKEKADTTEKKEAVLLGNKLALDARLIFYEGLINRMNQSP
ncbi:MAG: iron-containing redox enzyme family protein [Leptospiraceae bacterium]|nr:iron-containing redox enzyme family protein [Leptospiraceae bacterium]